MKAETVQPGTPLPFAVFRHSETEVFVLGNEGGRVLLLCAPGPSPAQARTLADRLKALAPDGHHSRIVYLAATPEIADALQDHVQAPAVRVVRDPDLQFGRSIGLGSGLPASLLASPALRCIVAVQGGMAADHARQLRRHWSHALEAFPAGETSQSAPVLRVTDVFDAALVKDILLGVRAQVPTLSGFMRTAIDGSTVEVQDHDHKVRRDWLIPDGPLRLRCREAIQSRLLPMIQRSFQFNATRMERYLVGCYRADEGDLPAGHFNRHRDNTTKGTAHRRFAVSIGLNAEDYDGGDLIFPEYGARRYRPPTGGAIVFSCSLLHEVLPVTRGERYAFLPFLFDEAAEQLRQTNLATGKA